MWIALALALAPSIPRPVGACKPYPGGYGLHTLDAAFANDVTPPSTPTVTAEAWDDYRNGGCDSNCGHPALVYLRVNATDDRAETARIGYKLAITRGQPPHGLTLPDGALRAVPFLDGHGEMSLLYDEDAPSDWSFDLEITAVDLNGNESEAVTVTVDPPP